MFSRQRIKRIKSTDFDYETPATRTGVTSARPFVVTCFSLALFVQYTTGAIIYRYTNIRTRTQCGPPGPRTAAVRPGVGERERKTIITRAPRTKQLAWSGLLREKRSRD